MSATEFLCQIVGVKPHQLSREENIILEADLFARVCEELKEFFKAHYRGYFRLMRCNAEMENAVMESEYVRCVINDILSTEEYTLSGIACYTQTPEEVVDEVAMGLNTSPSAIFLRKIIELHRSIRRDLYHKILKKIATECVETEE
jgi:hypothetical protein